MRGKSSKTAKGLENELVGGRVAGAWRKQIWKVTQYKAQQGALLLCLLGTLQEIAKVGGFLTSMEIYSGKEAAWAGNWRLLTVQMYDFKMHSGSECSNPGNPFSSLMSLSSKNLFLTIIPGIWNTNNHLFTVHLRASEQIKSQGKLGKKTPTQQEFQIRIYFWVIICCVLERFLQQSHENLQKVSSCTPEVVSSGF